MFPAILFPRRGFGPLFSVLLGVFAMGFPSTPLLAQRQDSVAQGASGALFIENVGQFDPRVRFQIYGAAQTIRLTDDGLWLTVATTADDKVAAAQVIDTVDYLRAGQRSATQLHLTYTGADFSRPTPLYRSEASVNYFRGNDPTQWQINVPVWQGVRYQSIYPGVDLEVTVVDSQLTQRLLVQPNVDLSAATATFDGVTLVVAGATALAVDASTLQVETTVGAFTLPRPCRFGYWQKPRGRCRCDRSSGGRCRHREGRHRRHHTSGQPIIHRGTTLLYGTFLGGGGDDDQAYGLAADASGNLYLTGRADASDFPLQLVIPCSLVNADIFVAKLNPQGNGPADLRYATFIGGGDRDSAIDIVLGDAGQATIAGVTLSSDFPTTAGAYRPLWPAPAMPSLSRSTPTAMRYSMQLISAATMQIKAAHWRTVSMANFVVGATTQPISRRRPVHSAATQWRQQRLQRSLHCSITGPRCRCRRIDLRQLSGRGAQGVCAGAGA
ncbi:MAG: SBBP repeat-containing protein [Caldilineaceae bacterium]